jgi:hypothetical protein
MDNSLVPVPILKEIEQLYQEDALRLDTAFNNYLTCSGLGLKKFNKFLGEIIIRVTVYDDECQTASEIFKCGLEKENAVTMNVYNASVGNLTEVTRATYFYA